MCVCVSVCALPAGAVRVCVRACVCMCVSADGTYVCEVCVRVCPPQADSVCVVCVCVCACQLTVCVRYACSPLPSTASVMMLAE